MINSMTAFAVVNEQNSVGDLTWEIRSVNHRYLEISWRLPDKFRSLEPKFREISQRYLARGKVECSLRVQLNQAEATTLELNTALIEKLLLAEETLIKQFSLEKSLNTTTLLTWPQVVIAREPDGNQLEHKILESYEHALQQLLANRVQEGEKLKQFIVDRQQQIINLVNQIKQRLPEIEKALIDKITKRVSLVVQNVDESRINQEIVLLVQKIDIAEEIDRLQVHLDEVAKSLVKAEPTGRRLDFLMQELHRETNTMAAKVSDSAISQITVELKVLIDQMREQIQNIE
ncbi:MAG: YicC family protein [Legionellales bacterium]|nr:YicC family protein [Legionellales bacterium]